MGNRRYRRMKCDLGLTYSTKPEKIEVFCEAIRELVRLHPYMRKDYYQVYLNKISATSLDILVYVFWEAPDWSTELRERQRFLLDILRIAQRMEVEFAYPTQTVYWKRAEDNTGNDEYKGDAHTCARSIVSESISSDGKPAPVAFPETPTV